MEITININDDVLVFDDWKNANGVWYRSLKSVNELSNEQMDWLADQGIILVSLNNDKDSIMFRWYGQYMSPIRKIYYKLYPNAPRYYQMKEYMQHIDKFLSQVEKLKVFV